MKPRLYLARVTHSAKEKVCFEILNHGTFVPQRFSQKIEEHENKNTLKIDNVR